MYLSTDAIIAIAYALVVAVVVFRNVGKYYDD
jgi:hypothetical protein